MNRQLTILRGIARGERALRSGHIVSHQEAKKRMVRWFACHVMRGEMRLRKTVLRRRGKERT